MHYEGPIYRPPSEANSLLVQATIGCPHNRCTFCMVYKKGPPYRERPAADIIADLDQARTLHGSGIRTLFFPAGNTIAMQTDALCRICSHAHQIFPHLERITVYGSSQYIHKKGPDEMKRLAGAGLSRIHVGLESGDDVILRLIKKGSTARQQVEAGQWTLAAGIQLSLYVVLGIGGVDRTLPHASRTADVLNRIAPDFIRLRTFVPKIDTPLLKMVESGVFKMLGPHGVLKEAATMIRLLDAPSQLTSDHYTNYINLEGRLPDCRNRLLAQIDEARKRPESDFRPFFIGDQ
ncbi:radical SAM protein [uncultured Desulfosarcina sp.]|uniref:radical SAM protein n=1 Tax=uncultured Desulfosarcina sp. TaxID=218289 RepID=UPI0029C866B9|nr:radical SAM protein [uncultured Desulfosarcina sp.]